jgi:hypothetical protein
MNSFEIEQFLNEHNDKLREGYACGMTCENARFTCDYLRARCWKVYEGTYHRIYVAVATEKNGGLDEFERFQKSLK